MAARLLMADYHHLASFEPNLARTDEAAPPVVSIITPQSATIDLFDQTAASVFAQSLQNWEWIVAEGSAVIADQRVRVLPVASAESARAPLVLFLDCGELLEPTALERLWWFLESHPEYDFVEGHSVGLRISDKRLVMRRRCRPSKVAQASNPLPKPPGKRRLLMLAPHLELGGADKFNLDLIASLKRDHAYEVTIVTTRSSAHRWLEHFERLTWDVFTLHTFLPVEDYARFISYLIESRKPDTVLIANSRIGYQLLPSLRTKNGPSFVDYLHMEDESAQGYPALSRSYAPFLDCTVVSSGHLKRRLVEAGGDPSRIHVSTTNIDPQLWDSSGYDAPAIRTKYSVPPGVPVIAFAGRLCRQKQPDVLAAVLKTIRDRGLEYVCLAAGDGDYRPWLEKFIARHRLHQIKLLGAIPSEQVREILAISDLYFMPSENEGIALTLFEAMSMGVPPVAAKVGGQDELVSPDCGILIHPGRSELGAYADALQKLLTDGELRRAMGSRARERIREHFTIDEMGTRMAELFESAAGHNRFHPETARKSWDGTQEAVLAQDSPGRFREFVATTLLLLSPRNVGLKLRNLSLLGRIFLHATKRIRLAGAFDARYYLSHNPDIRARGVAPLLHYALRGYLEDRLPNPRFDAAESARRYPGIAVNPLLWSIVQEDI